MSLEKVCESPQMLKDVEACIAGLICKKLIRRTESGVHYRVHPIIVDRLAEIAFILPIRTPNGDHGSIPPTDLIRVEDFKTALKKLWDIEEPRNQAVRPFGRDILSVIIYIFGDNINDMQIKETLTG